MQSDNRMSTREAILGYRMGADLSAVASFGDAHDSQGRLVQLSLEHLTLHLASCAELRPGQPASVVLGLGERWTTALQAEVTDISNGGPEAPPELRLRFVAPPLEAGRKIVSALESLRENGQLVTPEARPVWRESITRPERILRICEALATRTTRGVARAAGWLAPGGPRRALRQVRGRHRLEGRGALPPTPFAMEAFGYSSVLLLPGGEGPDGAGPVDDAAAAGAGALPPPVDAPRPHHHREPPVLRPPAVAAGPRAPGHAGRVLRGPVLHDGARARTCSTRACACRCMEVEVPGRAPVKLFAEVRNISSASRGRRCGLWVSPIGAESGAGLARAGGRADAPENPRVGRLEPGHVGALREVRLLPAVRQGAREVRRAQGPVLRGTQRKLDGQLRMGYRAVQPMAGWRGGDALGPQAVRGQLAGAPAGAPAVPGRRQEGHAPARPCATSTCAPSSPRRWTRT